MGESSCGGVAADFGRVVEGVGGGHGGRGGEVGGGRSNAVANPSGIRFEIRGIYVNKFFLT